MKHHANVLKANVKSPNIGSGGSVGPAGASGGVSSLIASSTPVKVS